MKNRDVTLICHNLRSCHNVGSLLRTADGLGVSGVYLTGYTPYPRTDSDDRLPYIAEKIHKQIHKTALGAETYITWQYSEDIHSVIRTLQQDGVSVLALEQTESAIPLHEYIPSDRIALIVGREVEGIEHNIVSLVDDVIEIPMLGSKESFNVASAAAMAMYRFRYW